MPINWNRLTDPFPPEDIEWKPGAIMRDKSKGLAMAYITARAVQERLDEVFGPGGWKNEFRSGPEGGVLCRIFFLNDEGDWCWREDGADNTDMEAVKGGLSNAMKRAGAALGIGRYLYKLPQQWVRLDERQRFAETPRIPREFLPQPQQESRRSTDEDHPIARNMAKGVKLPPQVEKTPEAPAEPVVEDAATEATKHRLLNAAQAWYGQMSGDEVRATLGRFVAELTKDRAVPETLGTMTERTAATAADKFERKCEERDSKPTPAAEPSASAAAPQGPDTRPKEPAWKQVKEAAEAAGLAREAVDTFLSQLGFATWQEIREEDFPAAMEKATDTTFVGSCNRTGFTEGIVMSIENAGGVAKALGVAEGWKKRVREVFGKNDVTVQEFMRRIEKTVAGVGGSMPKNHSKQQRQFNLKP